MRTRFSCLIFIVTAGLLQADSASKLWQQYVQEKEAGKVNWLPDFSYVGYKRGESAPEAKGKVFNVKDFGAIPDDMKDDSTAIQKAINAASKNGGGIVFLPKGRYLVNTTMANRKMIKVASDNIVIKGEGSYAGGTIIQAIEPYGGGHPHLTKRLYFGESVFVIHSGSEEKSISTRNVICKIAGDSPRETFSVKVDNAKSLKIGQIVYLYAKNKNIFVEMIKPRAVDEEWTNITQDKAYAVEIHRVKSVKGDMVTFEEPLRYDIKAKYGWTVRECNPIKNVGVEDICFIGNSYHRYKHHRSGYDDSGWAFIKMKGVTDGWVRRCSFINCNQTVLVALSSYVSMYNLIFAGNKGHHIFRNSFLNYGVFAGLTEDRAGFDHGPSLNWGCTGTVYWRCKGKSPIDSHAGRPYVTLFDNITAPGFHSSGGYRDYPQHLRFMVVWNMCNTQDGSPKYDFWTKGKPNIFLEPIIVGIHGKPISFAEDKLGVFESLGKAVQPESLYEAQIKLRLKQAPAWIDEAKAENQMLEKKPLPEFYVRGKAGSKPFIFRKKFKVNDLLNYVTLLSLQMYNSVQFTYDLKDKSLVMDTDRGLVRNALYSLMYAIYTKNKRNNTISAAEVMDDGVKYIRFTLSSGKTVKKLDADEPYVKDAAEFIGFIGGKLKSVKDDKHIKFELLVPQTLKSED